MRILITKKDAVTKWHTQAVIITTNLKVNIDFSLNQFSETKFVMWEYHVDGFAKSIYDLILGRDTLTVSGSNLKFSKRVIKVDNGLFEGSMAPTADLGVYELNYFNTVEITHEKYFMNEYV